jgi:hypothetical protein
LSRTRAARDLKLAQIHPDVDHVLSQSRKTDKIASSDVARSRVDWNTFHTMICLLLAVSSHAPAELDVRLPSVRQRGQSCESVRAGMG